MTVEAPNIISPKVDGTDHPFAVPSQAVQATELSKPIELQQQARKVIVLGAGISGLTTGILLREKGYEVEIWTKKTSPDTTSDVAGRVWFPYFKDGIPQEDQDFLTNIGSITRDTFEEQRRNFGSEATGIISSKVIDLKLKKTKLPWWKAAADNLHHPHPDSDPEEKLPEGSKDGFVFQAPVIEMPKYMGFLMDMFTAAGRDGKRGTIKILDKSITNISDVFEQSLIVVNCTGMGSRELFQDTSLHAGRGQVLQARPIDGMRRVLIDEDTNPDKPTYIVPMLNDMILGGSNEGVLKDTPEGREENRETPEETQSILERTSRLDPRINQVTSDDVKPHVGFRPNRRVGVRLKIGNEIISPDKLLVHNYGHGGSGITLSWGSAAEVVKIVDEVTRNWPN